MSDMYFEINNSNGDNVLNRVQPTQVIITKKIDVTFDGGTLFTRNTFYDLNGNKAIDNVIDSNYMTPNSLNIKGSRKLCWVRPQNDVPTVILTSGYDVRQPELSRVVLAGEQGKKYSVAITNSTDFSKLKSSQSSKFIEVRNQNGDLIWSYNTLKQSPIMVASLKVPLDGSVVSTDISNQFDFNSVYVMGGEFCGDYDTPNDSAIRMVASGVFCKFSGNTFYAQFKHQPRGYSGLKDSNMYIRIHLAYIPDYDGSYYFN